ncbi:aspartyl/asparaginyl beta-hydroxylase domain-containing protein [Burkholderia sp. Bp8990]|uniref:aspartyl/asparaginyl beta-hydroxylase domain-containing protein n=1 Tax=Burkholderia sp. Bp8990 TaxID=2184552 RepID=UPI000F9D2128|nr:aspartyl/asparaginyl beta-hydroxylase domain-containing protein [Burkholderia sp. Bp8990]RQS39783.1 aspartyl beta-hydroxylase [Burkholderia sp. Bp8990]
MPLLQAVQRNGDLWNADRVRQDFTDSERELFKQSPHAEVDDILLRFPDRDSPTISDDLICTNQPALARLPQARPLIFGLMNQVDGMLLGRVMITRLRPGKRITPHADTRGLYANSMQRYHVVLQGEPGAMFVAEDEQVNMRTGEVWQFNAHAMHECMNNSTDDRVHLIIDIRSE